MNNKYITAIENSAEIKPLLELNLIKVDRVNEVIVFTLPKKSQFTISDLDLEMYGEGALIVGYDGQKYIFYLEHFGDISETKRMMRQLSYIILAIAQMHEEAKVYIDYRNSVSRLRIEGPSRSVERSTHTHPSSISDSIGWLLRLKPGIRSKRID